LAYVIDQLTKPGDIVLDPFSGAGIAAREALLRSRKFVGFDINPVAVELTRLLIHPPPQATAWGGSSNRGRNETGDTGQLLAGRWQDFGNALSLEGK
jgi:hypothetical protein